jgi:hypothetical protein
LHSRDGENGLLIDQHFPHFSFLFAEEKAVLCLTSPASTRKLFSRSKHGSPY